MSRYEYTLQVQREIEHMIKQAIPGRVRITKADLQADFGGIDVVYQINGKCPLQIRVRFDRPHYAADTDVTFRVTEPAMIAADTYAPLMLFVWLRQGWAVAGKLVDVYCMADRIRPPLTARPVIPNGDGGPGFHAVEIAELVKASALLRQGDRDSWAAAVIRGNERTTRLVERAGAPAQTGKEQIQLLLSQPDSAWD